MSKLVQKLRNRKARRQTFSSKAVQQEVLQEAIDHPMTLYPLGASGMSLAYGLLSLPLFGLQPAAFGVAIVGGVLSLGSFAWHYFIKGKSYAAEKANLKQLELEQINRQAESLEQEQISRTLKQGFMEFRASDESEQLNQMSDEALVSLEDLNHQYHMLKKLLQDQDDIEAVALNQALEEIPKLALDAYYQGLSSLAEALNAMNFLRNSKYSKLESEKQEVQSELETLKTKGSPAPTIEAKGKLLVTLDERLAFIQEREAKIADMLYQAEACEASLERVRLEIPLLTHTTTSVRGVEDAASELERTINQAKQVQRTLQAVKNNEAEEDELFHQLGEASERR